MCTRVIESCQNTNHVPDCSFSLYQLRFRHSERLPNWSTRNLFAVDRNNKSRSNSKAISAVTEWQCDRVSSLLIPRIYLQLLQLLRCLMWALWLKPRAWASSNFYLVRKFPQVSDYFLIFLHDYVRFVGPSVHFTSTSGLQVRIRSVDEQWSQSFSPQDCCSNFRALHIHRLPFTP